MEVYSKVLARYRGRGRLFLREETPLACQVNVVQQSDGAIFVECQVIGARVLTINPDRADVRCVTLKSGGARVSVSHFLGLTRYQVGFHGLGSRQPHTLKLLYYAGQVDVSYGLLAPEASDVRFGLANLEFAGNTSQKKRITGFPDALRASLPSGELLIQQVDDYDQIVKRLKAVGGADITCHVTTPLGSGASLPEVTRDIEDLCTLLSFARGTKINWAYFDVLSEAGAKLHTRHVSRVTKGFTSFPVIHPQHAEDLLALLRCFQRLREGEEAHGLRRVFDHYTDAKSDQPFLEARGMLAAILIDFLLGRYRSRTDRHSIRKDFDRTPVQRALRNGLRELLNSALSDITDDEKEQFLENLQSLNRPAFGRVLREFADSLGVRTSEAEIRRITKIRNSLVHNASFLHDTDNHTQYFQLINFLDRILLGILGYTGHYVDCTRNWQRTEFCGSEPYHEHST